MLRQKFVIAAAAVLALSASAQAATLYVAVDGNDASGDGSLPNPYATIDAALANARGGDAILVGPGAYYGRVRLDRVFDEPVAIRSNPPYAARLRNDSRVLICYYGKNITVEGFDIAHSSPGAEGLVVHIQDLIEEPGGENAVSGITLRNNILHDSYNNDLLKINNGAQNITVSGNMFYNQTGSDEHIDINSVMHVTVEDNIFFNDFEGSGRVNNNDTGSFIVVKDSNADDDLVMGSQDIIIRRNVFLNWQGSTGSNFILCGEDGMDFYEAVNVRIENNLLLGNSPNVMRAAFGVKGCSGIYFAHNTVHGDLPALAYAFRLTQEGANLPNRGILFTGNVWSDTTGTMGAEHSARPNDFSDTPPGDTESFTLQGNAYWNGGEPIPEDDGELINVSDDAAAVIGDPRLPSLDNVRLPRWNETAQQFADGSESIAEAFQKLAVMYGTPGEGSVLIDAADSAGAPAADMLSQPRDAAPDLGAVEVMAVPAGNAADVNSDGFVNAVDVQLVINTALGLFNHSPSDIDGSGSVDAVDVQRVINGALGLA